MKKLIYILLGFGIYLTACEDPYDVQLDEEVPFLVVDAWLTHTSDTQRVVLTTTQPYFDNTAPPAVTGAVVTVTEAGSNQVYNFTDGNNDGVYEWIPAGAEVFGAMGNSYVLQVVHDGVTYSSFSMLQPVPPVDSITFEYYPEDSFIPQDYYYGEFWARDLVGSGNAYWIQAWKNGQYLGRPEEINIAYDAAFSAGGSFDSLIFIPPIRTLINRFDQDEDDIFLPPYAEGDSAYVEIHSISDQAWFFLWRVANETNRPGGFGELFADPLANSPTNLIPSQEGVKVAGFFNVAAVSSLGVRVDETTIRDNYPD